MRIKSARRWVVVFDDFKNESATTSTVAFIKQKDALDFAEKCLLAFRDKDFVVQGLAAPVVDMDIGKAKAETNGYALLDADKKIVQTAKVYPVRIQVD